MSNSEIKMTWSNPTTTCKSRTQSKLYIFKFSYFGLTINFKCYTENDYKFHQLYLEIKMIWSNLTITSKSKTQSKAETFNFEFVLQQKKKRKL